ncbi:hypothetical protein IEO21_01266 [Rhodonia placenta]|uniref:Uncharacterized protein n=1 Tax=Rhodonia placenta TaxID=104341 RepID=A0A8H7U698_9APHY|nr:hypothetical protein IEO21_01266 [Postia placenta]
MSALVFATYRYNPLRPSATVLRCASHRHVSPQTLSAQPAWNPLNLARQFSVHSPARASNDKKLRFKELRENIYTIPNILTASRILACPAIGYAIIHDNFPVATALLVYAGLTDTVDGWIARRFKMTSVLGTVLDPAADKTLMTTLTVTLAMKAMIPVPLAIIILGRDVLLSLSAFYIRYKTLPAPKTFSRYWDMSIPSAEVHPTRISKVNTLLQLLLMATTTVSPVLGPLLPFNVTPALEAFQWIVAGTTLWSGASYIFSKDAVRIVSAGRKPPT